MKGSLLVSVPIGFLATAIIVVNNLRDRLTDVHAGKRTMAVRFGEKFTRMQYVALVLGAYLMIIPVSHLVKDSNSNLLWIFVITVPMVARELRAVGFGGKDGAALNDHVGSTARLQAVYCAILALNFSFNHS